MPSSMLFGINNEGRVYSLYTNGTKWREFPYLGVEFKRLSAVPNFLWAVGGDRQIYVHVHGLDIPIRIKEEVYENQRWNPVEGFVARLLPTDRYPWSNKDGTENRSFDKIRVPSMAWQWETEWQKELTLDRQPLNHDGWTYAVDFPGTYSPLKQWTSTVRRRKWFRYRRYSALNSWCAIAPLHKDPTQEPFIDVCIGGQCFPGDSTGIMLVWAVTAHGRVMFRTGVSKTSPEGQKWIPIMLPAGCEVRQICCGPTGLTWAITWSGQIIVRTGLSIAQPKGESWLDVGIPQGSKRVTHVSVGTNSVWVITDHNQVCFRKGVSSQKGVFSDEKSTGSGWIEMVDKMSYISVAANDQVWAVGYEDQCIYYRMGISPSEMTGKKWIPLRAPIQLGRNSTFSNSLLSLGRRSTTESSITEECDWEESSKSAPSCLSTDKTLSAVANSNALLSHVQTSKKNSNSLDHVVVTQVSSRSWSPVRSVGSLIGMEVNPDTDDSGLDPDTERDAFLEKQNDSLAHVLQAKWSCVEAGAVYVSPNNIPDWFISDRGEQINSKAPWKSNILRDLQDRRSKETFGFERYEIAIRLTASMKSIQCRICLPGTLKIEECIVELEWLGVDTELLEAGNITFSSVSEKEVRLKLNMNDVTSVQSGSEPGIPKIKLYSVKFSEPIIFFFSSDTEHDDCLAHFTYVCSRLYGIRGSPSNKSFWATTDLGEVLTFDTLVYEGLQAKERRKFCQIFNMKLNTPPVTHTLVNSFGFRTELIVTGSIPKSAQRFSIDLESGSDDRIAFHFNPRFDQAEIVRNHKDCNGWGLEERNGSMALESGTDFMLNIVCDEIGFKVSINGSFFTNFEHRSAPDSITHVSIKGDVTPLAIKYLSENPIFEDAGIYWRQIGGHLKQVETCDIGVTWGIGFDKTPWVYSGGWGGTFLMGLERSKEGINTITDTFTFDVYENQRWWNPLTGFSSNLLPTDRHLWSDESGSEKRSKESCRLLNMHWHWEADWSVDYNLPGGTDKDGWQYALDFPFTYSSKNSFTDTVRRRRWIRVARYISMGPWTEVGNTKLDHVSLHTDINGNIHVWGIVNNGDVLYRRDVTLKNATGIAWVHVSHDEGLVNINGFNNHVWGVGKNGCSFYRYGITQSNPIGESWKCIDAPKGKTFVQICIGNNLIWCRDDKNTLYVREEVSSANPEGSYWEILPEPKMKFICIDNMNVWGITEDNMLSKRLGITKYNPSGLCWVFAIKGSWTHISVKS